MFLTSNEAKFHKSYCDACNSKFTLKQFVDMVGCSVETTLSIMARVKDKIEQNNRIKTRMGISWPTLSTVRIKSLDSDTVRGYTRTVSLDDLIEVAESL